MNWFGDIWTFADDVRAFHQKFGLPINVERSRSLVIERENLLGEEFDEYMGASGAGDLTAIADALGDIVYVCYGTAIAYGIDLDAVLAEIHKSNLTKTANPNGGKVLKGENYQSPDIAGVLGL